MRVSALFNQTLRETYAPSAFPGYEFLLRAGYVHGGISNLIQFNPLGWRSMMKIESLTRREVNQLNGQEISLINVLTHEAKLAGEYSGNVDGDMHFLENRSNQSFVFSATGRQNLNQIISQTIRSHRQLPRLLFQVQPALSSATQNKCGLFSAAFHQRFEIYFLNKNMTDADLHLQQCKQMIERVLKTCLTDANLIVSEIENPQIRKEYDYYFSHPQGTELLLICTNCGFQQPQHQTRHAIQSPINEEKAPMELVNTPSTRTIADLANYLSISPQKTAKAVFMMVTFLERGVKVEKPVMAVIRGDQELDEKKLLSALNAISLKPASDSEIEAIGAVPGFASPVGLTDGIVVVDSLIPESANLVAGANQVDFHYRNVNYGRDYNADLIADLTLAQAGDTCPQCKHPLDGVSGFRLASIILPEESFLENSSCYYQSESGEKKPVITGSGWIDLERLLAGSAEMHNDEYGLVLPLPLVPYQVYLLVLHSKTNPQVLEFAENLYRDLKNARIDVLFDDRYESPGVKFNDADLLGIPLRITIAERGITSGEVEFKLRHQKEKLAIPVDEILTTCMNALLRLDREAARISVRE